MEEGCLEAMERWLGWGQAAQNLSQSSGSVKFTGRLKSSTQFLGINPKDHKFNPQAFTDGLDWFNWNKTL